MRQPGICMILQSARDAVSDHIHRFWMLPMKFRTGPANRVTRVVAALVVLGIGVGILVSSPMPAALAVSVIVAVAGGTLCMEARAFLRERWRRRDPYDLSLLNDLPGYSGPSRDNPIQPPDALAWESEPGDTVYCHRCDVSMPASYSTCPKCGSMLGH
jgi:hypothetical protein